MMSIRGRLVDLMTTAVRLADLMAIRGRLTDLMTIKETCRLDGNKRETC